MQSDPGAAAVSHAMARARACCDVTAALATAVAYGAFAAAVESGFAGQLECQRGDARPQPSQHLYDGYLSGGTKKRQCYARIMDTTAQ